MFVRGVHHFSVIVSLSPFSRVLLPAICKSPAQQKDNNLLASSKNNYCDDLKIGIESQYLSHYDDFFSIALNYERLHTTFKELQVSVSVMQELDVVIG